MFKLTLYLPHRPKEYKFIVLFSLFLLSTNFLTAQKKITKKPNIIFILTDDLGYGDIGVFYQNGRKERNDRSEPWTATPNLDKMAHEGAMLTNHYTAAPVCAPSRSSLLSGLNQGHANVRNNQFDKALANNHTLGNVMQKAGYKTAAIGKWGLQGDKRYSDNGEEWLARPTRRGFDYFYGYMRHVDGHEHYPKEGVYRGRKQVWENDKEVTEGLDKCYTADLWTAAAKKWITENAKNDSRPFFMYLAYDTPHAVLELPTQQYPEGGGLKGGLQWLGQQGKMINTASGTPDSYVYPDYATATYDDDKDPATKEVAWPDTYKRYATSVRRIDNAVGDIIQLLKDLKIDENTLIVFCSDNGPSKESYLPKEYVKNAPDFFNSFGDFDGIKRDVLEGGERMPLIARWPSKISKNTVIENPSIMYDWLPTFIDAAGLPGPANENGVSLLPELTGQGEQQQSQIYAEYSVNEDTPGYTDFAPNNRNRIRHQMQMIRKGNMVGIRYNIQHADDDFEIYDIATDTHQSNNLAAADSLQDLQKWMKERVIQIRRPDSSAKRPYDHVPMAASAIKASEKGLSWKAYGGTFPWLPKMDAMKVKESGTANGISAIHFEKRNEKLYLIQAYIQVPETGRYTFYFAPSGRSLMRIHDATIFDADYNFKPGIELKEDIILEKGFHPVRIYLENKTQLKDPLKIKIAKKGNDLKELQLYVE